MMGASAQIVRGVVKNKEGLPLPGVSIYVKNSNNGVLSETDGQFTMKLSPGTYTLVFRMVGYEIAENTVIVHYNKTIELNPILEESNIQLQEAVIVSDTRDLGKSIIQKARDKRRDYLEALGHFSVDTYRRITLTYTEPKHIKDSIEKSQSDSVTASLMDKNQARELRKEKRKNKRIERRMKRRHEHDTSAAVMVDTAMVRYVGDIDESFTRVYFETPSKYMEECTAENEYNIKWPEHFISISIGYESEGLYIDNLQYVPHDPYMLFSDAASVDFNLYKPQLERPLLTEQPLLSPIAPASAMNYVYDYDGVFYEDSIKIYRIRVKPIFPSGALYKGYIFIEDSTWALRAADLSINPAALLFCDELRIEQRYKRLATGVYAPAFTRITYSMKEGRRKINGSTQVFYQNYNYTDPIPDNTFTTEIRKYTSDAFDHDSLWWANQRPIALNDQEQVFALHIDSLTKLYNSDEFLFKLDSSFNHIDIWSFLVNGIGFRNRKRQTESFINPLMAQINPVGIGGYRHRLGGSFMKRFKNEFLLETEGMLDYGFKNSDVRGKGGIGLTYVPKKFVRTFIRFGDYYDMINTNASFSSIFSRSNYARTQTFSVAQRMEVFNGFFAELTLTFSDQKPISGMNIEGWSNQLFGSINQPTDFDRYIKTEIQLEVKYRIRQRFIMKGNRKILMGSKWPDLSFIYRKGIPGLFRSEVNFDYLELGIRDESKLARWGTANWAIVAGSFVNTRSLRLLEHKYFRGSDPFFFSNPIYSFQLLGPTLSSSSSFLRANYIHHFEGMLFNKIPLLSMLRLSPAWGAGILMMEENHFRHMEFFVGIERVIRIRRQLFRLGVYGVTADNNLDKAVLTWKFGISAFDSFRKKWEY